jgi:hypothetical protein
MYVSVNCHRKVRLTSTRSKLRILVPLEHGVYRLGELSAACLVDTASINLNIVVSIPHRLCARSLDLRVSSHLAHIAFAISKILEDDLFITPRMRKNGIVRDSIAEELVEGEDRRVDETYGYRMFSNCERSLRVLCGGLRC